MRPLRRFVLLCLMLCLPLQGSWAAVAGTCAFDNPCAGQHEKHATAHQADTDAATSADAENPTTEASPEGGGCGGDCVNCHGHLLPALVGAPLPVPGLEGAPGSSVYTRHVTDPVPEQALRPPLTPRA